MIVHLRGTNGAGKTTVVRQIMSTHVDVEPVIKVGRLRPVGYVCRAPGRRPLFVPGHYEIANGGIDTLRSVSEAMSLIWEAHDAGHDVLFEGKNMQDATVVSAALLMFSADQITFAVLMHPVPLCVEAVRQRGHKIAEKTITSIAARVQKLSATLVTGGYTVISLDRSSAVERVSALLAGETHERRH